MARPRIGVTGPDTGGAAAWLFTSLLIWWAGGRPVRIRPGRPRRLDKLHGLVLGGGADIDPDTYEKRGFLKRYLDSTLKNPRKSWRVRISHFLRRSSYPLVYLFRKLLSRRSHRRDTERDQLEFYYLDQAVKRRLPVLGICRGSQLINIYFGGNLYNDIANLYLDQVIPTSIIPVKKVTLTPGSRLEGLLRCRNLWVNSLHHQAVKEPGEGIHVAAREANGLVQAIEYSALPYMIGVQWHPEYLFRKKKQRLLFSELVRAARDCMQK